MENFIQFCRHLGVHENLLFESDDLGKSQAQLILMHADQVGAVHAVAVRPATFDELRDPGTSKLDGR